MVKYIPILICTATLIYGGVVDYKRREIPNAVPIILTAISVLFGFSIIRSIIGFIVPAVLLLVAARIIKSEIPGGDFKLLCSLGFACGLRELAVIILLAGIGATIYGLIRHLPVKRHIPLCSYIASAYIAFQMIVLVIERR
ncbi:hypothetical protein SDC9_141991 [bioreactor metagenome]|uniref:Prepilin type IV endopeptidase peptidase domain-containing protein n=1 Tax=bioreactor metagenome TaxID=1076179 RepID=A0A645E1Y9_9ZZZZ